MKEYICYNCKKLFFRYASTVTNPDNVCCSIDCRSVILQTQFLGKNNPNYKDGKFSDRSYCSCGNIKDIRSKKCSLCARKSFAKEGARSVNDIDIEKFKKVVLESYSISAVHKLVGISKNQVKYLVEKYTLPTKHFISSGKAQRYLIPDLVLINPSKFSQASVKACIIRNNILEYKCECGLEGFWANKKLVLQLHHKDGNRKNNLKENLQFLCPNCHSQTTTFTGKNIIGDI